MRKKILFLLVVIFSLFVMACGKSKDIESERLENFAFEESIAKKNMKKYDNYMELYDFIRYEGLIEVFDEEYLDEIFDEVGFRDLEGRDLQNFGIKGKENFLKYGKILDEVKKSMAKSPIYYFDDKVEKLIETSSKLKENVLAIIAYYSKAEYKKDNYAKRENLNVEYNLLLGDFFKHSGDFITYMGRLEYDEVLKEKIKDLEKNKELALFYSGRFAIAANGFADLVFYRENFVFSDKEIKKLEEIDGKLKKELANIKSLTDEQLKEEQVNIEEFKKFWIVNAEEIVKYSTEIIEKLNKKEDIEETANKFEETRFDFVDMYSAIVM